MASCSLSTPGFRGPLIIHKSQFLGQNHITILPLRKISSTHPQTIKAKFDLGELLGGRGLCNGEVGLQRELKKEIENPVQSTANPSKASAEKEWEFTKTAVENTQLEEIPEDAFEKKLFGLIGGFPGGEKGLQKFIEGYPLHDLIKLEKNENIELVPIPLKKMKLPELKLKLPQLSSFTGNNRSS